MCSGEESFAGKWVKINQSNNKLLRVQDIFEFQNCGKVIEDLSHRNRQKSSRLSKKVGRGCGRVNMVQILCSHVCKLKVIPVETTPAMGEVGIKENGGGVNSSMIYLVYSKNFCKCPNVLLPSTTIKIFF
jgi:hypothetical protein